MEVKMEYAREIYKKLRPLKGEEVIITSFDEMTGDKRIYIGKVSAVLEVGKEYSWPKWPVIVWEKIIFISFPAEKVPHNFTRIDDKTWEVEFRELDKIFGKSTAKIDFFKKTVKCTISNTIMPFSTEAFYEAVKQASKK